ncbi:hypothetical protein, partial [Thiolapillus sp.]|uniref:hypothetical protein n=1 Tax=Thiolapillus sp. TaxID=2017437 RepID=UPI0025FAB520
MIFSRVACAFSDRATKTDQSVGFYGVSPFPELLSSNLARLRGKRVFGLVIDFGTSQSPKSTRPLTTY